MHRWTGHSSDRRAGLLNLTLAAAVGLLAWFSWWIVQDKPAPPAKQRSFTDVPVPWKCDQGHEYVAAGAFGPQTCPTCGAAAYVAAVYECRQDGPMEARLTHGVDEDGGLIISGIRFDGAEWLSYPQQIVCPCCGREMRAVLPGPFGPQQKTGRQPPGPPAQQPE